MDSNNRNIFNVANVPSNYNNSSAISNVNVLHQLLECPFFDEFRIRNSVYTLKQLRYNITQPSYALLNEIDNVVNIAESSLYIISQQDSKPKFNGETIRWFRFWESFEKDVHLQENFSAYFKFACLIRRLEGLPLNLITLQCPDYSYLKALNLLQLKYVHERVLVESHLNALLDLEPPTTVPDSLMQFVSDLEYHIRALKAYKINVEEAGVFVVAILNKKLPKKIFDRVNKDSRLRYWTLPEFHNALKGEIQLLYSRSNNSPGAVESSNSTATIFPNFYNYSSLCPLCSGCHDLNGCTQYPTPKMKMEKAIQLQLCVICLSSGHSTENCLSPRCVFCKGKHNTILCFLENSRVVDKKRNVKKKKRGCPLCLERHDISGCPAYKTSLEKMERAKDRKLCLLCIQDDHVTERCSRKDRCKFCREMHNSILCDLHIEVNPKKKSKNKKKNKIICQLCSGCHEAFACTLFRTKATKTERIKRLRICLICIKNDHTTENCTKPGCKLCGGKHNTSLCLERKSKRIKNDVCQLCSGNHDNGSCNKKVVEQSNQIELSVKES